MEQFWASTFLEENEKREEAIEAYYRITADANLPWRNGWLDDDKSVTDAELYIKDELDFSIPAEEKAWNIFLLGYQALRKNKLEEAKDYMEESLELYPKHSHVYYMLGYINYNKKDIPTAIHYLEQAINMKDNVSRFYILLSNIYLNDNIEKAVNIIETALEKCENKNGLQLQLVSLQFYKKDYDNAILMAKNIIDSKPGNINILGESYSYIAQAYFNLGDIDKALDNISYAEVYLGKQSYLFYLAGICYLNKGPEYYNQTLENFKMAEKEGFQIPENIKALMNKLDSQL